MTNESKSTVPPLRNNTALIFASENGHDSCVDCLLEHGANPCVSNKVFAGMK